MIDRPPIETQGKIERVSMNGHVFRTAGLWIYPCIGCGCDNYLLPGAKEPCSNPYSDPVGVERLLVEIRDLLKILVERGS